MEKNQKFLIEKLEDIISYNVSYHKNNTQNQNSLFSEDNDENLFNSANYKNLEPSEKLEMEFNAFGFYLSEHPTKLHKSLFKEKEYSDIIDLVNKDEEKDNLSKKIIGLISEKKKELPRQVKSFVF